MKTLRTLFLSVCSLAGCTTANTPPPTIALDPPMIQATPVPEPEKSFEVVGIPSPLPLIGQLKPVANEPENSAQEKAEQKQDPRQRVAQANQEARIAPTADSYVNAIQIWPYSDGALYQVYTSPGRITAIVLQAGEELVTVSAGDTVRWIVGDTASGSGDKRQVNIIIKPVRAGLQTNLIITTDRRTYLLELTSTAHTWMASASWDYPRDRLQALEQHAEQTERERPVAENVTLEQLQFRYDITGGNPPWKPLRAFDDGEHVYIQFPGGIAQGELPPLFVIGAEGDAQLVNYRFRSPYYVVDRLFGAAELRMGNRKTQVVRIQRSDVRRGNRS